MKTLTLVNMSRTANHFTVIGTVQVPESQAKLRKVVPIRRKSGCVQNFEIISISSWTAVAQLKAA